MCRRVNAVRMKNNKDKIMNDIKNWMIAYKQGHVTLEVGYSKILSLLGENEVGVLDAESEHGGLLGVIERNVSDSDSTEDSQHTNDGTLSKRIEDENICSTCRGTKEVTNFSGVKLPCVDCHTEERI